MQADLTPYHVACRVLLTTAAVVAGTNSYQKYGFVPGDRISRYQRGQSEIIDDIQSKLVSCNIVLYSLCSRQFIQILNEVEGILKLLLPLVTCTKSYS